jgi:hypothetical protein
MSNDEILAAILTLGVSLLASLLAAYATTRAAIRTEYAKHGSEIFRVQRHNYFLPFKYAADEFLRRLRHIEMRLAVNDGGDQKVIEMRTRFAPVFVNQPQEWFYSDSISPVGGYFLASTIYMNCVLFYWMARIQAEHPYIPLKISLLRRAKRDPYMPPPMVSAKPIQIKTQCTVYEFVKEIKVRFAGAGGISYGVHDAIGNALFDKDANRIANYDEFASILSGGKAIVFVQAVRFWTSLVTQDGVVDQGRLSKIRDLIVVLQCLQYANVREG